MDTRAKAWGEPIKGLLATGEVTGGVHDRNRLMGNSLLDITVFGRRTGINAAKIVKEMSTKPKLSFNHLKTFMEELKSIGVPRTRRSPMILPDYRGEKVLLKSITILS